MGTFMKVPFNSQAFGLSAMLFVAAAASTAAGALIKEDFAYTYGAQGSTNGVLQGNSTVGDGFSTAWAGGTTRVYVRQNDLTYTGGGYNITQASSSNRAGAGFRSASRGLYRDFAAMSGTVWFSFLMKSDSSGTDRWVAIQWNPSTANTGLSQNYIQLQNGAVNVSYNGVVTSDVKTGLGTNTTLVVGRWLVGAGNDTLDVWVNPASLNSLGTADFSNSSADIGASLTRLGLMGISGSDNRVDVYADAIRISDGGGNSSTAFGDVTAVPEPGSLGLAAAVSLYARRRRRG